MAGYRSDSRGNARNDTRRHDGRRNSNRRVNNAHRNHDANEKRRTGGNTGGSYFANRGAAPTQTAAPPPATPTAQTTVKQSNTIYAQAETTATINGKKKVNTAGRNSYFQRLW